MTVKDEGRSRAIGARLRELAVNLDALNVAASPHVGLNRTDMRALDILVLSESLTAGQLAARLKLTTGAVTGVLDRLEKVGRAVRSHDDRDRRRVVVRATEEARQTWGGAYRGLLEEVGRIVEGYRDEQLELLEDFLDQLNRAVLAQVERLGRR